MKQLFPQIETDKGGGTLGTPASDTTIMDQGHQRGIVNTTVLGLIFIIFIFSLWKRGSVEFQEFRE